MSISEEISKLAELHRAGTLSDEEFARAKAKLIDGGSASGAPPLISGINVLRRSRSDRWVAGICGGVAKITGIESWLIRLVFAALLLFGGVGLLLYVLMWLFVPEE